MTDPTPEVELLAAAAAITETLIPEVSAKVYHKDFEDFLTFVEQHGQTRDSPPHSSVYLLYFHSLSGTFLPSTLNSKLSRICF